MIRIIMCEGKTDAVLLSYYLGRVNGWQHKKQPSKFPVAVNKYDNQSVSHYSIDKEELAICSVGGKNNFVNFYKNYIKPFIWTDSQNESEYRLVFVTDRDDRSTEEIEKELSEDGNLFKLKDREWIDNSFENSFGQKLNVKTLGIIIPKNEQGALETLLMNALSEDEYKKNLIEHSKTFIETIHPEALQIIANDRLKLKSKLGVSLAVLYPEKVFSLIDEQLKAIHWESSEHINECFQKLLEI